MNCLCLINVVSFFFYSWYNINAQTVKYRFVNLESEFNRMLSCKNLNFIASGILDGTQRLLK